MNLINLIWKGTKSSPKALHSLHNSKFIRGCLKPRIKQ